MENSYPTLPYITLDQNVVLQRPEYNLPLKVTLDDPALSIMTDFRQTIPITIKPDATIDTANEKMIGYAVRLLLVTESSDSVLGLITSVDILGEKPLRLTHERRIIHSELLVSDIMTPRKKLEAIFLTDIEESNVGNIVSSMSMFGRRHALVIEKGLTGEPDFIRGIISATQITKQLGITITPTNQAHSFAELEEALHSVA
ncbi:hypothetical protein MNBD_GAMMA16-1542 [hydrothermal vent metagenome]|uniref:CBS domain-containing protein n=1 Tax=hydrothermal vent metagenome TaxID=652676 RepID=A0A3B0YR86_9ZZZZ